MTQPACLLPAAWEGISSTWNETIIRPSVAARRLLWTLNGPLESAIRVTPAEYYEPDDVLEPYFRSAADGLAPSWHSISQESMTEPHVSSTTVRISCIDDWEQLWVELFRDCVDTKNHPLRPRAADVKLEVVTNGSFLTVHEYVSTVHPWLMGMRETLLDVLGKSSGQPPWPPETRLAVTYPGPGPVRIDPEDRLVIGRKKPSQDRVVWSKAEREEARRKTLERHLARAAARIRELERGPN